MSLMLHAISSSTGRYTITPERFRRIVAQAGGSLVTLDDGFAECFAELSKLTQKEAQRVIVFLVTHKVGTINDWDFGGELAGRPLLSWEQILELSQKGIQFGSHSTTHPDLRKCTAKELEAEVSGSKRMLEDKLGKPVDYFCYPYGQYDRATIEAVKNAGYKAAFTTCDSIWQGRGNPYRMRRIEIKGTDSDLMVWLKLSGMYDVKALWELPVLVWEKVAGK